MQNFILQLGIQFSDEEKQKCLPTAHRMINLAIIAHLDGILALEDKVADDTTFMKIGVNLMLEGLTSDVIEKILQHSILSGGYTGTHLLDRLLITQGLTAMVEQYDSFVIANIIGAMLGEEYVSEIVATRNKIIDLNLNNFIDEFTFPLPESEHFEKMLLKLKKFELFNVLATMDSKTLSIAFKGCSKSFINHMRDGVSEKSFIEICAMFSNLVLNKEEILVQQRLILCHWSS